LPLSRALLPVRPQRNILALGRHPLIVRCMSRRLCWLKPASFFPSWCNCRPGRIHPFRVPARRQRR